LGQEAAEALRPRCKSCGAQVDVEGLLELLDELDEEQLEVLELVGLKPPGLPPAECED